MRSLPFTLKASKKLKIRRAPCNRGHRQAFYEVAHAPADHSNRRSKPKDYAVWEFRPVMALAVANTRCGINQPAAKPARMTADIKIVATAL
jgi:hypothetical protein